MNCFSFTVRWKDCDQAGIVFYPRYLEYINDAFDELMQHCGFVLDTLDASAHGVFPMVALQVEYKASMRLGDQGVIESSGLSIGRSSIVLLHRILCNGMLMVEAKETRVFAARSLDGKLRSKEVPAELRRKLLLQ